MIHRVCCFQQTDPQMSITTLLNRIILTAIEFCIVEECLKSQDYSEVFSNKYTIPRVLQILHLKMALSSQHHSTSSVQCLNKIFLFLNKRTSLIYFVCLILFPYYFVWIKTNQIYKKKKLTIFELFLYY